MALRGYMKRINGSLRMRFVMPGYDADDESVPPNKVIFDSSDIAAVSIFRRGTHLFPAGVRSNSLITLATWQLDFVPLCHLQFMWGANQVTLDWAPVFRGSGQQGDSQQHEYNFLRATKTGLYANYYGVPNYDVTLIWTAYNLPVSE